MAHVMINEHGLPVIRYPKLKPCAVCGEEVKPQYRAGLSRNVRQTLGDIFADSYPVWFICCEKCLSNLRIRIKKLSFEEQQKALNRLCREWNAQWTADSQIERLIFVKMEERDDGHQDQTM